MPSKYGAVRTDVDGITFASKREATRYRELTLLRRAGEIHDLQVQPAYLLAVSDALQPGGQLVIGKYIADFSYIVHGGSRVVEDAKGVRTALYRWKKKHVEAQYGITIVEV